MKMLYIQLPKTCIENQKISILVPKYKSWPSTWAVGTAFSFCLLMKYIYVYK